MAQIVCIADGTYREGLNEIGDIVSIHEDDVNLSGKAYSTFKVLTVTDLEAEEIKLTLSEIPEDV